jgi:predicted kinase
MMTCDIDQQFDTFNAKGTSPFDTFVHYVTRAPLPGENPVRLIILSGISGSGKSTWARCNAGSYYARVVSTDTIRRGMGDINDMSRNAEVFEIAYTSMRAHLMDACNVVYDATNVNYDYLQPFIRRVQQDFPSVCICVRFIRCDPEVAKSRIAWGLQAGKDRAAVPDEVVDKQHQQFERLILMKEALGVGETMRGG